MSHLIFRLRNFDLIRSELAPELVVVALDFFLREPSEAGVETRLSCPSRILLQHCPCNQSKVIDIPQNRVRAQKPQSGICRWRSISLHIISPRRGTEISNSQSPPQLLRQNARTELSTSRLVLLALKVDFSEEGQFGFGLIFEKSIVENLIVNVDFSETRVHSFPQFFFNHGSGVLKERVSQFADACAFDVVWQLEWRLEDAPFGLQEFGFIVPMAWHLNSVFNRFKMNEVERIVGSNVPCLDQVRTLDHLFEFGHSQPLVDLQFPFGHSFDCLIFGFCLGPALERLGLLLFLKNRFPGSQLLMTLQQLLKLFRKGLLHLDRIMRGSDVLINLLKHLLSLPGELLHVCLLPFLGLCPRFCHLYINGYCQSVVQALVTYNQQVQGQIGFFQTHFPLVALGHQLSLPDHPILLCSQQQSIPPVKPRLDPKIVNQRGPALQYFSVEIFQQAILARAERVVKNECNLIVLEDKLSITNQEESESDKGVADEKQRVGAGQRQSQHVQDSDCQKTRVFDHETHQTLQNHALKAQHAQTLDLIGPEVAHSTPLIAHLNIMNFNHHPNKKIVNCCCQHEGPGPGSYQSKSFFQQNIKDKKGYSWAGRYPKNPQSLPGPCSYSPDPNKIKTAVVGGAIGHQAKSSKTDSNPGPGQYQPKLSLKKFYGQTVFGKNQRIQQKDQGVPGPGAYTQRHDPVYTASPKFSFSKRISSKHSDHSPGPAFYNPSSPKRIQVATIGKQSRLNDPFHSNTPAPNAYNNDPRPKTAVPQYAFGKDKRLHQTFNPAPGPGSYNSTDDFTKNMLNSKGFSMSSKHQTKQHDNIPGPGTYNCPESRPPTSATIGRQKRASKQNLNPGPGTYNQLTSLKFNKAPNCTIGRQTKQFKNYNNVPGPGQYRPQLQNGNPKYSFRSKSASAKKIQGPGPAAYNPNLGRMSTAMGVIGRQSRLNDSVSQNPGPGFYRQSKKQGKKFSFPRTNHQTCTCQFAN